jgi:hypothetical protein
LAARDTSPTDDSFKGARGACQPKMHQMVFFIDSLHHSV